MKVCTICKIKLGKYKSKYCNQKCANKGERIKDRNWTKTKKAKEGVKRLSKTPRYCYSKYKRNSRQRHIEFKVTYEEFIKFWKQPCSYCGDNIDKVGLDRIDNSLGYISTNIISCCKYCNYAKRDLTQKEFTDRCKRVVNAGFSF